MFYADHYCRYEENHELVSPYHTYTFIGKWRDSGKQHKVTVKAPDLFRYRQGELIQNAFPYLSIKDREFLISGMWLEPEEEEE